MSFGARVAAVIAGIRFRGIVPLALMTTLILAVGAYTAVRQDAFLTSYNLRNLLLATMPLALVALGQTCALLVGGFDVSVGALLTFCVVARLVHDDADDVDPGGWSRARSRWSAWASPSALFNAMLVRVFRLPSIIATIWARSASSPVPRSGCATIPRDRSRATPSTS